MLGAIRHNIAEFKRRKARGDTIRPIWQIVALLPLALLYYPARWYVDFFDRNV